MFFWIIFGVVGLIAIPVAIFFALCGVDAEHKIGGVVIVVIFWFIISGGLYFQEQGNTERWNNGFCECGQHWELRAVTKSRTGSETKHYVCPDCHIEIEINN